MNWNSTEYRARSLLEDRIAKDPWGELEAFVENDIADVISMAYRSAFSPARGDAHDKLYDWARKAREAYIAHHLADAEAEIIRDDRQERIDAEVDARIDELKE